VSDTMMAALDAALQFHANHTAGASKDEVLDTAKTFYRELAVAAPNAVDAYSEDWYDQVHKWLRVLNGDQLGCVSTAVQRISAERNPPVAYQPVPMPLTQVPRSQPSPIPPAWALLDKLNGPQPYPGGAAAVGPLVTRDELDRELAKLDRPQHLDDGEPELQDKPPTLVPGDEIRIRPGGADPFTTNTYVSQVLYGAEGFHALVPPDAFSTATADQIPADSASTAVLLKILGEVARGGVIRQGTTLTTLVKDVVEDLQAARGQLKARDAGIREHEEKLREILGAWPESDDWDNPHDEETSTEAAQRVMDELEASEERVRELVWQLNEEQVRGKVREFGAEFEPPATMTVLRLICPPAQREAFGGYMMRCGEGWVRVQRKPDYPLAPVGKAWDTILPSTEFRARELTFAEIANWEAGR
jgi:hypothetical protein